VAAKSKEGEEEKSFAAASAIQNSNFRTVNLKKVYSKFIWCIIHTVKV